MAFSISAMKPSVSHGLAMKAVIPAETARDIPVTSEYPVMRMERMSGYNRLVSQISSSPPMLLIFRSLTMTWMES